MATESDATLTKTGKAFSYQGETTKISNAETTRKAVELKNPKLVYDDERRFSERRSYRCDDLEYNRTGKEPSLVLIFNNEYFENHDERVGTRRDVNEIIVCLQRYGHNIDPKNVLLDPSTEEIEEKLGEVGKMDLEEYNSLIVFFLTHGDVQDQLYTRDKHIWANNIWRNISYNKTLKGKPKIFVLQACKGEDFTTTGTSRRKSFVNMLPDSTFVTNYLPQDCLVVYSTIEGNVSYRNRMAGSWFIQELCKNILTHGQREDLFSLLIRTSKCVASNFCDHDGETKKQMPLVISTLRKKFYLSTNKVRGQFMDTIDKLNELCEDLINYKDNVVPSLGKSE